MRIGYARLSTQDQRLDVQHEALTHSGGDRVFDDTISGKVAGRPGLQKALDILREGDPPRRTGIDRGYGFSPALRRRSVNNVHG